MQTDATIAAADSKAETPKIAVLNPAVGYDYFEKILPLPPVCCGIRLKPLSIGRYRLMARLKVAFVSDNATTAHAGDLLMGALICSMDYEAAIAFIGAKTFTKEIQRWGRKIGFFEPRYFSWPFIGRWLKSRCGQAVDQSDCAYLMQQMGVFQQYIKDASESPPYFDESEGGRISGAHWSHSIEAVLREHQGWTKEEINNEPLTKALADYFKHMENVGMVRLMSDEDVKRQAEQKAFMEDPENEAKWLAYGKALEEEAKRKAANG